MNKKIEKGFLNISVSLFCNSFYDYSMIGEYEDYGLQLLDAFSQYKLLSTLTRQPPPLILYKHGVHS